MYGFGWRKAYKKSRFRKAWFRMLMRDAKDSLVPVEMFIEPYCVRRTH